MVKEKMLFHSAEEMLELLQEELDLYSPTAEKYAFLYNEAGSIACYNIRKDKASELAKEPCVILGECWSGLLGPGGYIYCDKADEDYSDELYTAMDFCTDFFQEEWVLTTDV